MADDTLLESNQVLQERVHTVCTGGIFASIYLLGESAPGRARETGRTLDEDARRLESKGKVKTFD